MTPIEKLNKIIRFIKSAVKMHNYTIAFSGGKDSCLLEYCCKEAGVKIPLVHNVTTIDPPGTLSLCAAHHATLMRPQRSYLQLVEDKGLPSMYRRFCCGELKERYIADYVMTGVRQGESVKRRQQYLEPETCFHYKQNLRTSLLHPLLFLNDADVEYIINDRQIECHPLYYDGDGTFHVERRLGCIGCPLLGDRGRSDYLQYPKLLRQVYKSFCKYAENHQPRTSTPAEQLAFQLFYSNHAYHKYQQAFQGLFPNDAVQLLETYFHISLK